MILSIIILILHVEKINLTYLDCKIKLNPTYLHLKMKNKYIDLIEQTFEFPNEEFKVIDNELYFNDVPLMDIIKQYGTPLKISYLPKITSQIQKAKRMFNVAMAKVDYQSNYNYCYCTKSSHFSFVMEEALKNDISIETSSAFDINIINELFLLGKINKERFIICNGFKRPQYVENIAELLNQGFINTIPVLDNKDEIRLLDEQITGSCKIGIRIAAEEEPMFEFYTSRLGMRYNDILSFYIDNIKDNPKFELKMLHFFINTGIKDSAYYWNELSKCVNVYCELKKICPELDSLNIGGGFPIKNNLGFNYDYEYMAEEIIGQIKNICDQQKVAEPNIFTEFGSFTVGESGATLFSIIDQKQQNDRELWNMIDSSFMTTLPDTWAINQRYILLAINNWDKEYQRVFLGGLTCDSQDFYNAEAHSNAVFLPKIVPENLQYIGFFHTGAYQESLGGYGGIQHCLTPAPKHIIIDIDEEGEYTTKLFAKEQSHKSMLKILGY
jgi:arginine decarboxylase